jgi:hypothetical protein
MGHGAFGYLSSGYRWDLRVEEKVIAEKITFAQAAPYLSKSVGKDSVALEKQCNSGAAQCWRLQKGKAYMLTRAENKELVVCCFEGENLGEIITDVIQAVKESGFSSIRFHTKRPAILKLIRQEFELVEYVFRRNL